MNLKQVIDTLEKQGHTIEYSHRKDGGYVIRSIDGVHYKGKQGNAVARLMVGTKLSEARRVQLESIRTPKGKRQQKLEALDEDIKRKLRKVQKEHRKRHPTIEGTQTTGKTRWRIKQFGKEKAMESLDKALRYEMGIAYKDNVLHLLERIEMDLMVGEDSDMESIYDTIKAKIDEFKEEWISQVYYCLYEWEKGSITGQECARRIRSIIS